MNIPEIIIVTACKIAMVKQQVDSLYWLPIHNSRHEYGFPVKTVGMTEESSNISSLSLKACITS